MRKPGRTFNLPDDRIERAVDMLRRTEIPQTRMRLGGKAVEQRCSESRLPDAGLTGQKHHLALTALRSGPTSQYQFDFFFAPNKLGESGGVERIEPAFHRAWTQWSPGLHRDSNAFEFMRTEIFELEQIADEFPRVVGDDNHVWLCDPLQTGR